jgi:nudix-type nucleoside diphosphatase (YffH/AdpP family)
MTPKILNLISIYKGWSEYLLASVRLASGLVVPREIVDHGCAVSVLPYDPVRKVALLVKQLRVPVLYETGEPDLLEALAGVLEDGDATACAQREAREETGLELGTLEPLGAMWTTPGFVTERMDLFLAQYSEADRVGKGGGAEGEHENIIVVEMPLVELAAMADARTLTDMKTFALVQTLRLRKPELFAD